MSKRYDLPYIVDAHPLKGYHLFIEWSDGSQTIYDASPYFNKQKTLKYSSPDEFAKVGVNSQYLYWGDEDYIIMVDDIYDDSFPFLAIVNTSSQTIEFLSMAVIKDMAVFPIKNIKLIKAAVHGKELGKHHEPHVHIIYGNYNAPFKFDGTPISMALIDKRQFDGSMLKAIKKWITDPSNHAKIIAEWNKTNPEMPQ